MRKNRMRGYACMAIMCLACVFSFWLGRNVGTVQALKEVDTEVAVMENVETGTVEEAGPEAEDNTVKNSGRRQSQRLKQFPV